MRDVKLNSLGPFPTSIFFRKLSLISGAINFKENSFHSWWILLKINRNRRFIPSFRQ